MGELPMNATAPAILNAIYNAVGVRVKKLPARPGVIRELLRDMSS
jgi:aldehyde oxidoreductase